MTKFTIRCCVGVSLFGLAIAALPASASPRATTELICHTSNPLDCYPRIFQPTKDFQIIREDQDLPPGLHIRMNIYTGLKEARLNIPMEGEEGEALEIPMEQAVVVVPQTDEEPQEEPQEEPKAMRDRVPQKPPAYEAAGKIQPPREPDGSGEDAGDFQQSLKVLASPKYDQDWNLVDSALVSLSDLSHDIYYGLELTKRGDILKNLVAIMMYAGSDEATASQRRRNAASIIGSSIQNNPTALQATHDSWNVLIKPQCTQNCEEEELFTKIYHSLEVENDAVAMKAKMYALHGLMVDGEFRNGFLSIGGVDRLLSIFRREGEQWDPTRTRIAQVVMDTFLDEDLGAELGIWPTQASADSAYCASQEHTDEEGCWEYHLARQGKGSEQWMEFLNLLKKRRVNVPLDREL